MQEPEPLGGNFLDKKVYSSRVAPGTAKAGDQTKSDWVLADAEYDWNRRGCGFGRLGSIVAPRRGNNCHAAAHEVGHQ